MLIGSRFKGSVIGGIEPTANGLDYQATSIDPKSGASVPGGKGKIPYDETLESVAKTLGVAVGVPKAVLDDQITRGSVVEAALA